MAKAEKRDVAVYVPIEQVHPNDWNDNEVSTEDMIKLERGMRRLLASAGKLPPIIVRPHPAVAGEYQIIDGEHRWKIVKEKLRHDDICVDVIRVDDATSRILTETLNYLRGTPNDDKKAELIADIVKHGERLDTLHQYLPDSDEEIKQLLDRRGLDMELMKAINDMEESLDDDEKESRKATGDNTFVEVRFMASADAALVIESEIDRLSGLLEGKNKRGRALELMAVTSALSSVEDVERMLRANADALSAPPKAPKASKAPKTKPVEDDPKPWSLGTERMTPRSAS